MRRILGVSAILAYALALLAYVDYYRTPVKETDMIEQRVENVVRLVSHGENDYTLFVRQADSTVTEKTLKISKKNRDFIADVPPDGERWVRIRRDQRGALWDRHPPGAIHGVEFHVRSLDDSEAGDYERRVGLFGSRTIIEHSVVVY